MRCALLLSLGVMLGLCACATAAGKDPGRVYDAGRPLTTLHGIDASERPDAYALNDFDAVLDHLLVNDASGHPLPFVLYLHGRGDEPQKSFGNTKAYGWTFGWFGSGFILEKIESGEVRVLGLNWASKVDDVKCGRPIAQAEQAAPVLIDVLDRLTAHRAAHPDRWDARKRVLLVHSLGSFVLKKAMAEPATGDKIRSLFDVRLITGSDAAAADHATWLPAGTPGQTVVVTNARDKVLRRSVRCGDDSPRLGTLPSSDTTTPRAAGAMYVQIDAKKSHRTFTRAGSKGNVDACATIASLMRGVVPAMDAAWQSTASTFHIPDKKTQRQCKADTSQNDGND